MGGVCAKFGLRGARVRNGTHMQGHQGPGYTPKATQFEEADERGEPSAASVYDPFPARADDCPGHSTVHS